MLFPGPVAVVRGMGYCDWPEPESHVQTCGLVGRGKSTERGVLDRLPQLPVFSVAFSCQRLSVVPWSLLPACRTDGHTIHPLSWERGAHSRRSFCGHTDHLDVSVPEPEARCVNVQTVSWYREFSEIYISSIFMTFQKISSCQTTCLLPKDHLLTRRLNILQ